MQQESNQIAPSEEFDSNKSYAEFRVKKSYVKWLVVFAVVLFVVFLGLLLASVLISTSITKDVNVKDGELVSSKDKSTVIKTSEKIYTQRVSLDTPLDVVKNVKTISVYIESFAAGSSGQPGVFKFYVTGFERIPGRKLVFHGHTHSANILADGKVQIIKSFTSNSKRDVDVRDGEYAIIESLLADHPVNTYNPINTCSDLLNLDPAGTYRLETNLACTLTAPLPSFRGMLNGNGNTLTITLNTPSAEVALFQELNGAGVFNLVVDGTFTGAGRCAAFAVQALPGTSLVSNKAKATITCHSASANPVFAAPYVAEVFGSSQSTKPVTFQYLLSASNITVDAGASSRQGGFFAVAHVEANVVSKFNYFFSSFTNIPVRSDFSIIGTVQGGRKRDWCNNPNDDYYNAYCWQNFQYNDFTGQCDPTQTWWDCCEAWVPCAGCMYDNDPAACRFVLCTYQKRTESTDVNSVISFVPIPFIQYP